MNACNDVSRSNGETSRNARRPLADAGVDVDVFGSYLKFTVAANRVSMARERFHALAELRQRATREGHCYQHVQVITVAIDQYAEKALGNRDYFLNKPYGVG
jgi:hypothetical protein